MNRDDPIALLGALDPAEEKDVDALVSRLSERPLEAISKPRGRRPLASRRATWLCATAAAAVALTAVLVADPFSRSGAISSAQAKAQVARSLDLTGAWHVRRVTQMSRESSGAATPHWGRPETDDVWHSPDGRLRVATSVGGDTSTWLYANGERRAYDSSDTTLTVHRFALPADLRDDMRSYLPPSAADLYRAAYRVGKVRLAGTETVAGRRVYRLAFDWLGSSYTLVFDATRQVPISSESRTPNGRVTTNGPRRYFFTRVRYTAYERVQPGPALDSRLTMPPIPGGATVVQERPIVVPVPVRGASARLLARAITDRYGTLGRDADPARATYALVVHVPGGGIAAVAQIPSRNERMRCTTVVEIAHPGGEARLAAAGCSSAGGFFSSVTHDGGAVIAGGLMGHARAVELRSADGRVLRAHVNDGRFLVVAPRARFEVRLTAVVTEADGSVTRRPWPTFSLGDFTSRLNG